MNFNGIKKKLLWFKSILVVHWTRFTVKHPRYNKPYYHAEIKKMMNCGSETYGFVAFQCLSCGEGKHIVNFSCKGKVCQHGNGALGFWNALAKVWLSTIQQHCWIHKTANFLDKFPETMQPKVKDVFHNIYLAVWQKQERVLIRLLTTALKNIL